MTWRDWVRDWHRIVDEFLLGASLSWTLAPYRIRYSNEMDYIVALILNAQMLGLPLLPPTGTLRLLPYFIPKLMSWRRMSIFDHALEGVNLRHLGH